MGFVRGDTRVLREMKNMKWQMDLTGDIKKNSKMDFKISQSDREIVCFN